jgi:large subunit ribosomal protein L4
MTAVDVKNIKGEVVGSVELDDRVFGIEPNTSVVHQAVVAQLANQRKGTADTKTRGEVRGGTHKMWRQKGTGRARQGDRRAPHWVGGGVVFGPHPRSYHKDMPVKMRRLAMRSALSSKVSDQEVTVIDELALSAPKTREVRGILGALGLDRGALIVLPERDADMLRASRNLQNVRAVTPGSLNLLDVLKYRHLVLTRPAVDALTAQLTAEVLRGRPARPAKLADEIDVSQAAPQTAEPQPTVDMDRVVDEETQAGAPADVAMADAAEKIAEPADGNPAAAEAAAPEGAVDGPKTGAGVQAEAKSSPATTADAEETATADAAESEES